ncbi:hypothetical protein BU17DRAFT_99541 [Hysterangium stoloniferum]|nr:hypothetical protein BU17DRAFT_99541 [Hysterangium stoloniferum]
MSTQDKKPVLYVFPASVWATAPLLAVHELDHADSIEIEHVNLAEGANFKPAFLKINPNGTLPTLATPDKTYKSTADVVKYIIESASKAPGRPSGTDLIDKLHDSSLDPNFSMFASHSEEAIKAKGGSLPGHFVRGRQAALAQLLQSAPEHAAFYAAKAAQNGQLVAIFGGTAPPEVVQGFIAQSKGHWASIAAFVAADLPGYLPDAGFIGGERPGEDDFHLAVWLARTVAVAGGGNTPEGILALEGALGGTGTVPKKVQSYWNLWRDRESWKEQYADSLH